MTSRPLASYPGLDPKRFVRYALQHFGPDQVETFIKNWFKDRQDTDPSDSAHFRGRVEQNLTTGLSRIPLLLTLAALIYEEDREKPLPTTRSALYERFIGLLLHSRRPREEEARADFRQLRKPEGLDRLLALLLEKANEE